MRNVKVEKLICLLSIIVRLVSAQPPSNGINNYVTAHGDGLIYVHAAGKTNNGLQKDFWGTGFFISSDGQCVTAAHVLDGVERTTLNIPHPNQVDLGTTYTYWGTIANKTAAPIQLDLLSIDDRRDLALLRIRTRATHSYFETASGRGITTGDGILALGFLEGAETPLPAAGIVTNMARPDGRWFTDAGVNPGQSGGPVIRRDGKVIGVIHAGLRGNANTNLFLPFSPADPLLRAAGVTQDTDAWPPTAMARLPETATPIPLAGSCDERSAQLEDHVHHLRWKCEETSIPEGGTPHNERKRMIRIIIPSSARIVSVRYFHRTRGDFRNPLPMGPWHTNAPEADLQWMSMGRATLLHSGDEQIVEVECRNSSHNLAMYCALGVQYQEGAWVW